ncbi:MAG: tripartite tricarboxylate transporter substrate binding protein [Sphaerochaeta sp.]|nr:tripartite tricarboxylate transporter substrate binding protein [Sphaerochaeta sp.]
MRKRNVLVVSLLLLAMISSAFAQGTAEKADGAANYPVKNIEFTVPYSAGGGTDGLMRLMTAAMEKDLGKPIVVINRGGNLGQIGLTELSSKKADGYSIGALSNLDHILVLLTGTNVAYDYDSFEYIGAINTTANVIIASKQSGITSLEEMISAAKAKPGNLTVSISGKTHIAEVALVEQAAGIKMTTVMQSSGGNSLNALLGGHVDLAVLDKKFVAQVEGQGCPTLAILSDSRSIAVPEVPTISELGYDVATETYRVIIAPKGTPKEILSIISDSMKRVTSTKEFQDKMAAVGEEYRFLTSAEVKARLDKDYKSMVQLVKDLPEAFGN